jgi:hypothetical protein
LISNPIWAFYLATEKLIFSIITFYLAIIMTPLVSTSPEAGLKDETLENIASQNQWHLLGLVDIHSTNQLSIEKVKSIITDETIELIIIAGDLTTAGSRTDVENTLKALAPLELPIMYVPGNMDSPDSTTIEFNGVTPLHGLVKEFNGLQFLGLGASTKTPFPTPYTLSEEELSSILKKASASLTLSQPFALITHDPPYGSGADKLSSGKHVGCKAVKKFVEEHQPLFVLCGHIHESQIITQMGESLIINPGPARDNQGALITITSSNSNNLSVKAELINW